MQRLPPVAHGREPGAGPAVVTEHAVRRTRRGPHEGGAVRREHALRVEAGLGEDRLREVVPGRLPRVGAVVDTGGGVRVHELDDPGGQVTRPRGLAHLVGDHRHRVVRPREPEHRRGEVRPVRAVDPGGPDDVRRVRCDAADVRLAVRLGPPVGVQRVGRGVLGVGRGAVAVEHVVRRDRQQLRTVPDGRLGEQPRAGGVDRRRVVLVALGVVDLRVRRGVDDDVVPCDGRVDRRRVRDVEVGTTERGDVTTLQRVLQVATEHAGGAGDQVAGHARAARSFSGSHQARLSRYHCTTSARPCSNGTCGS